MKRQAGVLMHVSSLPNNRGIGSFGKSAYQFVDFLADAKLSVWQVLPLCPTSYGDSPYQSPSSSAGNPYFIDVDFLIEEGLLKENEVKKYPLGSLNYEAIYNERFATLKRAFMRFNVNDKQYLSFKASNAWLEDYSLFMAIKTANNMRPWFEWSDGLKNRTDDLSQYNDDAEFWKFIQYKFFTQWNNLRAYANGKGVKIVGDMPIYVARDSADVWANPKMFLLDQDKNPTVVAGCPPDYFSEDGQLWGNPIYDWDYHQSDNFSWWVDRLKQAFALYDIVRIDHFRGFADYYAIPFGSENARVGEWRIAPGSELFKTVKEQLNNPQIIAEDLGELHDCVIQLVKETGYPGMKILQFAFDGNPLNEFLYNNYNQNCVAYTGTHDNDTTLGWYKSLTDEQKQLVSTMTGEQIDQNNVTKIFIEKLFESNANTVIIPMQDYLNLDESARMNTPSTLGDNWQWRLNGAYKNIKNVIKNLVDKNGRH